MNGMVSLHSITASFMSHFGKLLGVIRDERLISLLCICLLNHWWILEQNEAKNRVSLKGKRRALLFLFLFGETTRFVLRAGGE